MSSNTDTDATAQTDEFDAFVTNLSDDATEALEQIQQTVESAEGAATESADVTAPVVDALGDLSAGDRAGAANAALKLFDDDTRTEIAEARAAILAALTDAQASGDEVQDVIGTVAQQADDVAEAVDGNGLMESLRGLFE